MQFRHHLQLINFQLLLDNDMCQQQANSIMCELLFASLGICAAVLQHVRLRTKIAESAQGRMKWKNILPLTRQEMKFCANLVTFVTKLVDPLPPSFAPMFFCYQRCQELTPLPPPLIWFW